MNQQMLDAMEFLNSADIFTRFVWTSRDFCLVLISDAYCTKKWKISY